jgi:hypothetical protein
MDWFKRLPGYQRTPAGLEWKILKRLPMVGVVGTVLPALALVAVWWTQAAEPTALEQRNFQQLAYMVLGWVILHWTLVVTVAIGCVIVWVMKGPAYVADAYPLSHSDKPKPPESAGD